MLNTIIIKAGNRRIRIAKIQMRINFGVNTNYFGQLIRSIFGSLRINLGRMRITFANGFFGPHSFSREVLCHKEPQCELIRMRNQFKK